MTKIGNGFGFSFIEWNQVDPDPFKEFHIQLPCSLEITKIYACIVQLNVEGEPVFLSEYSGDFSRPITLNLSTIVPGAQFCIMGFQGNKIVAQYCGNAESLELLDEIRLRPVG